MSECSISPPFSSPSLMFLLPHISFCVGRWSWFFSLPTFFKSVYAHTHMEVRGPWVSILIFHHASKGSMLFAALYCQAGWSVQSFQGFSCLHPSPHKNIGTINVYQHIQLLHGLLCLHGKPYPYLLPLLSKFSLFFSTTLLTPWLFTDFLILDLNQLVFMLLEVNDNFKAFRT